MPTMAISNCSVGQDKEFFLTLIKLSCDGTIIAKPKRNYP